MQSFKKIRHEINKVKVVLPLIFLFFEGCTSYKIPLQTENHPANPDISVFLIELSPILDIDETIKNESKDEDVYSDY